MANILSEEKKQQVLALGRLGWSLRQIQYATRIRRETASQYLKAAGIAVRPPGAWGRRAAKPANEVITDSEVITDLSLSQPDEVGALPSEQVAPPQRSPGASACEAYREAIELGLSRGRNAMAIWQDLVDEYSFASSYQSVQRFVRKLRGVQNPEARVVIVTAPGQEAQVDYGTGPMVRDPESRKYRRTRLFVMTLGSSRKAVRLLCFRSSARIWAELHERAFRRLGGATRIVVLDNLREGVLVPDIYDSALNPLYRDVLAHYGAVAMPCRVQDPDRKGKVESGVGHAQKTPLKGLRFESLEEAQAYLDRWEERWADTRIHGTTKRQVATMFAEEKPFLLPLPVEPFRYYLVRRARRALGRLRRSRSCLLRRSARLDRARGARAMGRVVRSPTRPQDRPTATRTRAPEAWLVSHPARRSLQTNPATRFPTAVARRSCWRPHRHTLRSHSSPTGRSWRPPHPRRSLARQKVRRGCSR
jgi:transposase